jgi:hypothetical protein
MGESLIDPILGRLTWDEAMGSWFGELEVLAGQRIEVFIDFDKKRDSWEVVLSQARAWVVRIRQREPGYRRRTADQLAEGRWNKDEPMTTAAIEGLLRLASLVSARDGSAQVYWDDADVLFYGHGFSTQLSASGACLEIRGN